MRENGAVTGSTLKLIAMGTMLLDHIGAVIVGPVLVEHGIDDAFLEILKLGSISKEYWSLVIWYSCLRLIGRLAFPIFCFLLVEGFWHTHSRWSYAKRLLLFALISEIPFDLAFYHSVLYGMAQNVFFTLFIGLVTLMAIEWTKTSFALQVLCVLMGVFLSGCLHTDYYGVGIVLILVFYWFRQDKRQRNIIVTVTMLYELTAPLALFPINQYNGQRGLKMKYVFYIFYPAHLLLLYGIHLLL